MQRREGRALALVALNKKNLVAFGADAKKTLNKTVAMSLHQSRYLH